jgi:hypothetical protein
MNAQRASGKRWRGRPATFNAQRRSSQSLSTRNVSGKEERRKVFPNSATELSKGGEFVLLFFVRELCTAIGQIRGVLRRFFWRGDCRHDAHMFGNRSFPTKHTKDTKALSYRFCFINVLRVFRGQLFRTIRVISVIGG